MYTIMGMTGQVGGATTRTLLKNGKKVRGIVRDKAKASAWAEAGVELVAADWGDAAALAAAFRDAEGVFVMVPPNFAPSAGYPEARAVARAVRGALEAAGPEKVVALSSVGVHREHGLGLITQCRILEEELASLSLPRALIRAGWFLENFTWDVASAREKGEIAAFLHPLEREFPMVSIEDIGELVATVLQQDWQGRRVLELEGSQRYSQLAIAETFARLLRRPVSAKTVPREKWQALFEEQGMAADCVAPRIEMLDGFNSGWIDFERNGTEHLRGNRTPEEVFRNLPRKVF